MQFFAGEHLAVNGNDKVAVLFAGVAWPLTFKWFAKLGAKQ